MPVYIQDEIKTEWQIKWEHKNLGITSQIDSITVVKSITMGFHLLNSTVGSGTEIRQSAGKTVCIWFLGQSQFHNDNLRLETKLRLLKMNLLSCSQYPEVQRRGEAVCAQITLSEEAQTLPGVSSADSTAKEVKDCPTLLCKSLETGKTPCTSKPILSEGTGRNEVTIPASALRSQDTLSLLAQHSPCTALPALLQPSPPLVPSAQTSRV